MGEKWKKISGFDEYYVSSFGNVKHKNKKLKPIKRTDGRLVITLYKDGKQRVCFISRLVATAFINNKENKPYVDHIDRNVSNNNMNNLRWVTQSENLLNKNTIKYRSLMLGENKAVDVAKSNGIPKETFYRRIRRGWSALEASIFPQNKYTFNKRKKKERV